MKGQNNGSMEDRHNRADRNNRVDWQAGMKEETARAIRTGGTRARREVEG